MTTLAHQLKRLALPQNDPSLFSRKKAASLLFDPKEASNMDKDTFFAIGCTGLEELMGIDSSFEPFQDTLFSHTSKSLERSVQTKAVNEQLDESISLFLTHLSPYFMLKPAQKCLEWLIHRFHIHLYNQDSLIGCVLPYHETRIFVRVIQLLSISDPTHKWNWLHPIQKPGVPLPRSTLITHCYKDMGFLEFICRLVTKSVKVFSDYPGSAAQLRVLLSFYVSSIVAALNAVENISDTLVSKLLPYIQKGLKSSLVDYKAATYMIICQLTVKSVMADTLVKSLASQISRTLLITPSLVREGVGCLIIHLQSQQYKDIGSNSFNHLCKVPDLVPILQGISGLYDTSSLLTYLLPNLVRVIIQSSAEDRLEDSSYEVCKTNLEGILGNIPLEKDLDKLLARTFLKEFLSYGETHEAYEHRMSELGKNLLPLIRLLENKYPEALDKVLEEHLKDVADEEKQELFHQFISLSTSGGKYELLADCDTSLLLSLNHPQPAVRHLALQHLKEIINTSKAGFDEAFIQEAILGRLVDDNLEVVLSALSAFKIYKSHFSTDVVVTNLLALFDRVDFSQGAQWYKALEEAADLIQGTSVKEHPDLCIKVFMTLIPYMVFTNNNPDSAEHKMALFLAKCGVCNLHPLLKGWPEALEEVLKKSKKSVLGPANSRMIELLSSNMATADSSLVLKMVEDLVHVAERESDSLRQKVTCHIVSHALVQGCCQSQDSDLQAAVRVFQLLEKRLRRMESSAEEISKNFHLDAISGDKQQMQLLTDYIEKLNSGQTAEVEEAVLATVLLRNFISVLISPESFPRGDMWWNPESMDNKCRNYLQLLIKLFDVIVWGASEGAHSTNFRSLMGFLFKEHLNAPVDLFNFLSVLWTYSCSLSNPLGCTVSAMLQTRALYIGHILLGSQTAAKKKQWVSAESPVVVCLLINLTSPVREVRRAAISCLQALSIVKDSPYFLLIQNLVLRMEEIVADATFVVQALGNIFEELKTPGPYKSLPKSLSALGHLLTLLQEPSCPSYIGKVLMKTLQEVNGETVLSQLLPVLDGLLEKVTSAADHMLKDEAFLLHHLLRKYNEYSAGLLVKNSESLDIFIRALNTTQITHPGMPTIQITALGQITKAFYTALDDGNVKQKVLGVLFDLLLNCKNPVCAQAVSSAFKSISISSEHISAELEPPGREKSVSTVRQTRRQKMMKQQRKTQDPESTTEEGSVNWPRTTLILELLQHKKKLKEPQVLVPSLFYLLSRCLEPLTTEQSNLEYTKQLILSCLLNICQKISLDEDKNPKDVLDEEKFNVELIVQCVRTSEMPQTHHHALLLLGAAAGIFPEKVLHNIMPIFTFMGANVMRLDDTYSFQVISKTVQTVIPALIQAGDANTGETRDDIEQVVSHIIHVFVDALPHVPEHRRLPILSQLLDTVEAQRFLWVLLVLLFQQHVTKTVTVAANGEKDAVLETDTEFWVSVCCEFNACDQLQSLIKLLQFLTKLPENKDEDDYDQKSRTSKPKSQEAAFQFFSVETHSAKQLRHFKFLSVSFMAQLLASHRFVGKVVEYESAENLKDCEQRLLEEVLCYVHLVAGCVESNADKPTVKFWRALLNKSYEMLDKVNALLPTETFIPVIRGLMSNQLPSVRRKAMDLLNNKLQQRTRWEGEQVELLLGLIKDLLSVVHRKANVAEEEQAINRQTALYSLKLLCKCFGAQKQQVFVPVLSAAVDLISAEGPEEKNVVGSALLCIAEVTSIIKALAIPQLPRLMPALISALKHKKELLTSEIHLLSTVTALQKVVETLPHFLSPYLHDSLLQVARLEKIAAKVGPTSQLSVRVTMLKTTLATNIAARVLLPAVTKGYCQLVHTQQSCLGSLMDILKEHIAIMDKQQLSTHQSELTSFFLKALDYRTEHSEDDLEQVGEIEGHIINCLLIMVMKLSEVTFRPLFFKLFDWSKTEASSKDRLLTFCRLSDCIADKLKGLFTLFAGHLVKPFAEILNQTNTIKSDEAFFDSENNTEKSCLLLENVLHCLHKIFLYDTQHFVSKERAELLMMPLVDQLENMLGGDEKFQARVSGSLVPCISQFSVAMADDSLWKPLNYQILLKMRHSSPKVRFAALLALVDLVEKLRENYMVLLPESIPFLAELMEDECEEVEQQCQKTIKQLEIILGESLQSYF
ncbi:HEAT repeat-containing protein 1 [Bombina bombina]|uniref:HEAT repeat-containing protein 1 n=1 Tax=Bombina bombina TaxID=8345 RepID=UPI00235A568D|nr:HEAT repeat-containing protein 1 [Bombina bombina]